MWEGEWARGKGEDGRENEEGGMRNGKGENGEEERGIGKGEGVS